MIKSSKEFVRKPQNEGGISRLLARLAREKTMASYVVEYEPNSFVITWPGGYEFTVVTEQTGERKDIRK